MGVPCLSNCTELTRELQIRAANIRGHAIRMATVQGQGYVGQALGISDVLAVAYFYALTCRPAEPRWEHRDRFLLSVGHYAIALYAALIERGVIPQAEIEDYGCDDSRLPMSGMSSYTPGMEITGGSLGHGLGIAVGMCLALIRKKSPVFVYNLLSDGELNEGSTWEAAMSAAHWSLGNLIALVDVNDQQADGATLKVLSMEPLLEKWTAFGWFAQRVDGNDIEKLLAAFDNARSFSEPVPRIIICETKMGKGVPFLEAREKNHFIRVEQHEWELALQQLDAGRRP
jgi:transketolase